MVEPKHEDGTGPNKRGPKRKREPGSEAEWAMVRHTKWIVGLTFVTAVAAILAAVFAGLQWRELHSGGADTHSLAIAAHDQAEAASAQEKALTAMADAESGQLDTLNQSVAVAKTAAEAAQRLASAQQKAVEIQDFENSPAFTLQHIDITGYDGLPDKKTGKINITAHVVFQNIGNVRFIPAPSFFWIIFRDDLGKPQRKPIDAFVDKFANEIVVAPGVSFTTTNPLTFSITPDQAKAFKALDHIYIFGDIRTYDNYSNMHSHCFIYVVRMKGADATVWAPIKDRRYCRN